MILTTHALAGAVIGKNLQNPWLIILLSLIVHFIMDSFRHGEYVESLDRKVTMKNTSGKVLLDISFGILLILLIGYERKMDFATIKNMLLGSLASVFPDFITFLYWKYKIKFLDKYYQFHSVWLHASPPLSEGRKMTFRNSLNELLLVTLCISILLL